ncbi:unnamed protein product [Anisakis simplex]|uniref:Glyco_hydro_38C domain-containing protein n=1 Tax=Anisakis simplex TaxID=6269 RepID=A0A0M3IYR5_ANISI|nr:unnamed protein product [Anisakis simplex]
MYLVNGPLYSTIYERISPEVSYTSTMMYHEGVSSKSILLNVWSNATQINDTTLMMQFDTSIRNNATFYTDNNGLNLRERCYDENIPMETNIYPVASEAMIEDDRIRMTLLSGQPTGATSLNSGGLSVMLDRRLLGDDGKGVGFGEASESYPSELKYRIVFEKRSNRSSPSTSSPTLFHSLTVQRSFDELLYPPNLFIQSGSTTHSMAGIHPLARSRSCYFSSSFQSLITEFFRSLSGRIFEMNLTGTIRGDQLRPAVIAQRFSRPFEIHSFGIQVDENSSSDFTSLFSF